jgi:hypothetical protein
MTAMVRGVIHGRTIELSLDPGLSDGQEVEIVLRTLPQGKHWGDGIRASAGGWADDAELPAIMERIQRERQFERRPQEAT